MKPRVSIVVRCRNEAKHIGRLLEGIAKQTLKAAEVIVVDSGSTDGTLEVASKFGPRIFSIDPEEFTFGRSLNIGCRAARADLIVIASAHVYPVYTDWLEKLVAPFSDPEIALTYGGQKGAEVTKFSERRLFEQWFPRQSDLDQPHAFCNNANAAVRRSLWEAAPYDETLTGLEDVDWARRIKTRGYKVAYIPEAEIVHVHEETLAQIRNRYRREAQALARIDPSAALSFTDFVHLFLSNVLADGRAARRRRELRNHWMEIVGFRFMQFWGAYGAFRDHSRESTLKNRFYSPGRDDTEAASPRRYDHMRAEVNYASDPSLPSEKWFQRAA